MIATTNNTAMKVIRFLAIIMIIAAPSFVMCSSILSSSSIELCERHSTTSSPSSSSSNTSSTSSSSYDEPAGCTRKIVMTLAVDGGTGDSESILAWQTAADAQGDTYSSAHPVRITVRKSQPLFRYPLYYVRNFNAQPEEETIFTSLFQCADQSFDSSPTCGRAYDGANAPIAYSEGFCCSCSACELFGLCDNDDRAYTRCSLFGDAAAAACLTFGELWYSAFRVGPAETWYAVEVIVETTDSQGTVTTTTLTLGPDRPVAVADDNNGPNQNHMMVLARLVGDFAPFREPMNLESHMLFVPSFPQDHPRVHNGEAEWMLVPSHKVSVDGRECNKIGVSYEGFNSQGSRCDMQVGSCLRGQLEDLRSEDIERLQNGLVPLYLVSGRGDFRGFSESSSSATPNNNNGGAERKADASSKNTKHAAAAASSSPSSSCRICPQCRNRSSTWCLDSLVHSLGQHEQITVVRDNFSSASSVQQQAPPPPPTPQQQEQPNNNNRVAEQQASSSHRPYLAYSVQGIQASVITLIIDADRVALSVNVAPARILFVNVSRFAANSREGRLTVTWMSTGQLVAKFFVTVHSCSVSVLRVLAQSVEAGPRVVQTNSFFVSAVEEGVFSCNVTLQNALYKVVDTRLVHFYVNATKIDRGAQGGNGNGAQGSGANGAPGGDDGSCSACAFYNPVCFVGRSCIWQFALQSLGFLLLLGLIFALWKLAQFLKLCGGNNDDEADDDKEDKKKKKKNTKKKVVERRVIEIEPHFLTATTGAATDSCHDLAKSLSPPRVVLERASPPRRRV